MGLVSGLLEWMGVRRRAAAAAPGARPPPVEPIEQARNVTPAPPAASPAAVAPAPQPAPAPDEKEAQRAREIAELRRSFQRGILDARFRDLDVDLRFVADFARLLEGGAKDFLPPPAAAFDVMRIVDDPGYPVKKVAAAISCDPTLAGSVVTLANSPLHRGAEPVDSLPVAIVRLGQHHLRRLLLEIALGSTRVKARPYESFSTLTWKHSLLVSQLAFDLARKAGLDADHAYMAGLFHDVGTFAILAAARRLAHQQDRRVSAQTVLKLIDAHARSLDERIVAAWRLPEAVTRAVIHRRSPAGAGEAAGMARVVALANDLGRPLGAWVAPRPIDFAAHESVRSLGLAPASLPEEKAILEIALKIERVAGTQ